jgi:DNA-binding NtrC family response regulator
MPGCEVVKCLSAQEALDALENYAGEIDLIISDNLMPGTRGVDLLIEVRQRYPNTVRVMLTGHSDLEDAKAAINEGEVYRFLTKPCAPEELKAVVRHAFLHRDLWLENRRLRQALERLRRADQEVSGIESGAPEMPSDELTIAEEDSEDTLQGFIDRYFA